MWTSISIFTTMFFSITCPKYIESAKLSQTSDSEAKAFSCQPNITYKNDFKTCVCTNNGQWPNNCTSFGKLYNDKVLRSKCKKNSYVTVHCNICKCNHTGQIDYQKCTKHACESSDRSPESRKFKETINGKCNPKTWYSFAPCQLCYCINDNKLICNPANDKMKTLVLGTYNFTICGDMFLKDTIDLMPDAEHFLRLGKNNEVGSEPIKAKYNKKINEAQHPSEDNSNNINQSDTEESNETLNSVKGRFNRENVDSNSAEADDEDGIKNVGLRTQMPEYDKPASGEVIEHANKQKSEESDSEEVDVIITTEPTLLLSNQIEVDKGTVSSKNLLEPKFDITYKNTEQSMPMFSLNLPHILKNIINLGFRRAHVRKMVSLASGNSCEPGAKMAVKCNTCFCMRNGKLLCTMKLCAEEF